MARSLPITTNAVPVFPGSDSASPVPQTIYNTGTVIVYLGEDQAVQPYSGVPLRPGSTIQWDAYRSCYALTGPGAAGAIVVLDNQGYLFDAGAIATQILDLGLAADIASQIAMSGAPPINVFDVLVDMTTPTGAGVSAAIDVSKYQSLQIYAYEYTLDVTAFPVPRIIRVQWRRSVADPNTINEDQFYVTDNNGAGESIDRGAYFEVPVRGGAVQFSIGLTARAQQVRLIAIGTYKTVPKPRYFNNSVYGSLSGTVVGTAMDNHYSMELPATAGINLINYPPCKSGPATIAMKCGTALTAGLVTLAVGDVSAMAAGGQPFLKRNITPTQNNTLDTAVYEVVLPNRPLLVQITTSAAVLPVTAPLSISIEYTD